jgi:hypothetical protein
MSNSLPDRRTELKDLLVGLGVGNIIGAFATVFANIPLLSYVEWLAAILCFGFAGIIMAIERHN